MDPGIFAIKRFAEEHTVYALTNISAAEISLSMPKKEITDCMTDLITGQTFNSNSFTLKPYQYVWLTLTHDSE